MTRTDPCRSIEGRDRPVRTARYEWGPRSGRIPVHPEHKEPPSRHGRFGRHLLLALAASGVILVVELWGAYVSGSLALLGDAGHVLTDMSGLVFAYVALWWAGRPATHRATYGFYRAEVLAAGLNGFLLVGVVVFLVVQAVGRLRDPRASIDAVTVLWVAGAGLVVNVLAAALIHRHSEENINARGAFWNVLGDALASVGVLLSAVLVHVTGNTVWDTGVTFVVAGIISYGAWGLLRSSSAILLERAPPHIDVEAVRALVESVDGVIDVHDLHVWTLTPGRHSATLHVCLRADRVPAFHEVVQSIEALLEQRYGLTHCTIQPEPEGVTHDD